MKYIIFLFLIFNSSHNFANVTPNLNFTLPELGQSTPFELAQSLGKKTIIINFFASWCTSCITEIPILNKLHADYNNSKFLFLAINAGEREPIIKKFLKKYPFDFKILMDQDRNVSKSFGILDLPRTIVISVDKKITYNEIVPPSTLP